MTTKKLWDFAYFAHGKHGQFGGWSSNEVEHWLMCALCICAPRNQNNSALWSNKLLHDLNYSSMKITEIVFSSWSIPLGYFY